MKEKTENCRKITFYMGACVLCIMVFCILPVSADYFAGVAPDGTLYEVTFTMNNDGSATAQGATIGAGGTITPVNPINTVATSGDTVGISESIVPVGTGVTQNLILDGQDGWAEVIAMDANGNQAHAEVYTDGTVRVYQSAWVNVPFVAVTPQTFGPPVSESGVEARQCVWSDNFTSIDAETYGFNVDKSFAGVEASAQKEGAEAELVAGDGGNGGDNAVFFVHQEAGVSIPVQEVSGAYSKYRNEEITYADQFGCIKNVDSGEVSAGSYLPQGVSALVSGWVSDGNLKFGMGASARNAAADQDIENAFSNSGSSWLYKATAGGDVEARGESGGAIASSSGPDEQFAMVDADFRQRHSTAFGEYSSGRNKYIDFDLSASGKIYVNGNYKVDAEDVIYKPCGYDGNVSAWNSQDYSGDHSEFDGHHAGGVAGVIGETGGSIYHDWAYTWPRNRV